VDDEVLDPACGSGTITVEAYKQIDELSNDASHQEILDRISAVDINKFPLHLTALNLASRSMTEPTDEINAYNEDFFNLHPMSRESDAGKVGRDGDDGNALGKSDAVVANPPYVRQEDLFPSKEHFREHLKSAEFRDTNNRTPYFDGDKKLSARSDLYVYFITHATQFLRDGGRLGFIVPSKWMNVKYGAALQEFLYDHYRIDAVVGFRLRVFEDALVDSVLILAERAEDEEERRENVVNFVRINEEMSAPDIVDTATFDYAVPEDAYMKIYSRPNYRTTSVRQSYLMDEDRDKIEPYLFAPNVYIQLLENEKTVPLNSLGSVSRGETTGANAFFFIDEDDARTLGTDDRFLQPALKSIRQIEEGDVLTEDSTDRYLLDVHDYVEEVRQMGNEEMTADTVKRALSRDGYDSLREYIEQGEAEEYHERRTCATRKVWFDLGELNRPEIIHPGFFNERIFAALNKDRLPVSDVIQCAELDNGIPDRTVMAILSSTVYKGTLECWGRREGGGALKVVTYELSSVPVPDVREMSDKTRADLADAYDNYLETGDPTPIDETLVDFLDLDATVEELQKGRELMTTERVESGKNVEVLVEEVEDIEVGDEIEFRKAKSDTDLSEFAWRRYSNSTSTASSTASPSTRQMYSVIRRGCKDATA